MLRVGLTGSIAVGKSFVAAEFEKLGCHVLDADDTAREVVEPGSHALAELVVEFGEQILQPDGSLDRAKLGTKVFGDEAKRQRLNAITHPAIIAKQDERLREFEAEDPDGIAIVDAALMIESGGYKRFDKLVVVHCDPEEQLKRLMARSNLSEAEATKRILSQMPQEQKKSFADYLIDTTEGFDAARRQTEDVYKSLLALSSKAHR